MASSAAVAVEALLRERKLDGTLTSSRPQALGGDAVMPIGIEAIDRHLADGLPRDQVSEVVEPQSSGRTSLVWATLDAATRRGESVALIDTFDRFDPATGAACGIDLSRLLWARGPAVSKTAGALDPAWLPGVRAVGGPGTLVERAIDRALKALNLVVQSGVCTLVVIDLIDVPAVGLRRIPAATWLRVQRAIEGGDTAVVLLAVTPVARSPGGKSIVLGGAEHEGARVRGGDGAEVRRADGAEVRGCGGAEVRWKGAHDRSRRLAGIRTTLRVRSSRAHNEATACELAIG